MSSDAPHTARFAEALAGAKKTLVSKGIQAAHLVFGGQGTKPKRNPTAPTDARSEFLANRAMGDWAERMLSEALLTAFPNRRVVQYGDTSRLAAGDPDFKASYLAGIEATRQFGKRPDLLLFPKNIAMNADLTAHGADVSDALVRQAIASIEVRSSKFDVTTYMAERKRQREAGGKPSRESPSFTVKVEDLVIVYRWLERYGVPQSYCQVFFDSIYAINFLSVFEIIANGTDYSIDKPEKSQGKATIMIPITRGTQVGKVTSAPEFTAKHRVTKLGRHDVYVVPVGGNFVLDADKMRQVLLPD